MGGVSQQTPLVPVPGEVACRLGAALAALPWLGTRDSPLAALCPHCHRRGGLRSSLWAVWLGLGTLEGALHIRTYLVCRPLFVAWHTVVA